MLIEIKFETPFHSWGILHVFKKYFEYFQNEYSHLDIKYVDSRNFGDRFQGGVNSAHIMTIKNITNGKYLIVSYWDKIEDFFYVNNGWDVNNCVGIITSSGTKKNYHYIPFTYLPYTTDFELFATNAKKMEEKINNNLFFRGYIYDKRLELKTIGLINISNEKVEPYENYFNELTNNKICLSLNGAGEICNRDIEILSARSVLLRPKLNTEFHNKLIPNYHYISFETDPNPKIQSEIIIDKFNEIKNNTELLNFISENGHKWFWENGTIYKNVEILKQLINIDLLK
jgi:hypothetical protein